METLVSTAWLADHLGQPGLSIVDASWYLPDMGRNARAEYAAGHIAGAVFFDIDEISDQTSPLPHMMPDRAALAARLQAHGIGSGHQIVVYDGLGHFSAPRMWWMIRQLGQRRVAVLDGGLAKWTSEGRALSTKVAPIRPAAFDLAAPVGRVVAKGEVRGALTSGELVLDARAPGRFEGTVAEPRPGLRSGHMPGAQNLFFKDLLNPDGTMKPPAALRDALAARGWTPSAKVTASCGSGVTAAVIVLALAVLGEEAALYDGSWAEWGQPGDTDVLTGPASKS
jgi:thiosulfate/3-mercaptopyruvate sulfurtransferase